MMWHMTFSDNKRRLPMLLCLLAGIALGGAICAQAEEPSASPLADAAERGDFELVETLLNESTAVDTRQGDGTTALIWAAYHDEAETVRRLLAAGADATAANRYGVSALAVACVNGNGPIVKQLLSAGADANVRRDGGETVLMTASRTGKLEAVQALIQAGAEFDAKDHRGQTALMWAAAEGHADVVGALIKAGAEFRAPLKSGFTPLAFAVRNGRIEVARRLVDAGADVNRPMAEARGGRNKPVHNTSPLLLAMENGHFELAAFLLEAEADPNDDRTGFAPLHAMSWIRKPERGDNESGTPAPRGSGALSSLQFVRVLVDSGAEVNFRKRSGGGGRLRISTAGTTPLLCAASTADVDFMKLLIELGADPKATNALGQNALMMAAGIDERPEGDGPASHEEHYAAVEYVLGLEVNDINAADKNGQTAMHAAAYKSLPKVIQLLDQRGADIHSWARKSKQGRTPLSIAQGFRPGNFKPDFATVAAIQQVMRSHGIEPPPPPKRKGQAWSD